MLPTLEVRWFLPGPRPDAVQVWFDALGDGGDVERRTDRYLVPSEGDDLGLKTREGRIEAKQRAEVHPPATWGRAQASPEAWRKWTLGLAVGTEAEPGWVDVAKARRQHRLDVGAAMCMLELASVTCAGAAWWSVCLEASGGTEADRRRALDAAARRWLDRPDAPVLPLEAALGYPAWLRRAAT